ncbi:MAG: nicotinamide mononucleotide transporter [Candidatus Parvibacillus calidus]|nr:MAG: nicotinamide mononucleotide transporter [Candidatus Parvibacillus calidus]
MAVFSKPYPGICCSFFGVVSVWYSRKNDILVYPTGIVSVLLYVYICLIHKLYADAGVNFYYFVMSVVGWVNWSKKRKRSLFFLFHIAIGMSG